MTTVFDKAQAERDILDVFEKAASHISKFEVAAAGNCTGNFNSGDKDKIEILERLAADAKELHQEFPALFTTEESEIVTYSHAAAMGAAVEDCLGAFLPELMTALMENKWEVTASENKLELTVPDETMEISERFHAAYEMKSSEAEENFSRISLAHGLNPAQIAVAGQSLRDKKRISIEFGS